VDGHRRFRAGASVLAGAAVIGTAWFWLVEGFSFVEALYQTTTTITTVGFGEVRSFDTSAQLFAVVLMIVGVSAALFTLGGVFQELVEGQLLRYGRRRMDRRIDRFTGHTIVCGFGRVGSRIAQQLASRGEQVVVVDLRAQRCDSATQAGYLSVEGDSTEDDVLKLAGLERAETLVISLASDADAISTVLSARVLNSDVRIVARANAESTEAKLARAGVDHVVNPLSHGARRLAAFALQPAVADFLDVVVHDGSLEYRLEELTIPAGSPCSAVSMADAHIRSGTGALVLAVRAEDGTFLSNPDPSTLLMSGSTVIAIGTQDQLSALERHLQPAERSARGKH